MPVAIALSGGGAQGDFQVGVLQFLYELGIRPEIVCATSVGSVNGTAIAEGNGGLQKLVDQWMSLIRNDDMCLEEPWFKNAEPRVKSLVSKITSYSLDGPVKITMSIASPLAFIFESIGLNIALSEAAAWKEQAEKAKSLYNLSPLEARMRGDNGVNVEKVRTSGIKLRLAVVSLESGELQFVTESGMLLPPGQLLGEGQPVDLISAVLASSGIPLVFPAVKLADHNYVDGGVREIVPVRAAIELGANRVFVIVASKYNVDPAESFDDKNLLDIGARAATEIMPNEIVRSETHPFKGWGDVEVKVIQPNLDVHDTMTIDPGLIRIAIAYGYMRASDVVQRQSQDFYSSDISELRRKIWEWEHDL